LHNDPGMVFLSPFLGVRLVEPFVVCWHKMLRLQDLQRLLLGIGATGDDNTGTNARGQSHRACRMEHLSSRHPLSRPMHLRTYIRIWGNLVLPGGKKNPFCVRPHWAIMTPYAQTTLPVE